MAAFVRTSFLSNYRRLPRDARQRLGEAMAPGEGPNLQSLQQLLGRPDFLVEGTTDSNTAVLNSNNPQSYLINLSDDEDDLGNPVSVEFPAGYERDITIECWTEDEDGPNYQKIRQTVRNTAGTFSLQYGVQILHPDALMQVNFATAAAAAGFASGGLAVTEAAVATGRYAWSSPKARTLIVKGAHLVADDTTIATGAREAIITDLVRATGVHEFGVVEATNSTAVPAFVAPGDADQVHLAVSLLPIESPELAIATGTTPDNILVGALGQTSENVHWKAHVWVGELRPIAATANSDA